MSEEIWKNIHGYGGKYQVSNLGRVRSIRYLKPRIDKDGYLDVKLHKDGDEKTRFIHRLVAKAFIKNVDKKPQVNHIDNNPKNNKVDNLEWVTASENLSHEWEYGQRKPNPKPFQKKQIRCSNGKIYQSITEAADELDLSMTLIYKVLVGQRKTTGGYSFELVD